MTPAPARMTPALLALCRDPGGHALPDVAAFLERILSPPHPIGTATDPRDERLRFHHSSALGFAGAEVAAIDLRDAPPLATLTTSLLGLCGVDTPLPHYLADEADRDDDQGAAVRGLLDVVHHRLFSLLLRGLRELDVPACLRPAADDPWSRRLLALFDQSPEPALPAPLLLRLFPAFATGTRSPSMLAAALRIAVAELLGDATIHIEPWTGGWSPIDPDQWTHLGHDTAILGETAVLGTEVLDPAGAVQIVIGPLGGEQARAFAPGGPAHATIAALFARFAPTPSRCDLALDIEDLSYPPSALGERRLGEDLWLWSSDHPGTRIRHHVPLAA